MAQPRGLRRERCRRLAVFLLCDEEVITSLVKDI